MSRSDTRGQQAQAKADKAETGAETTAEVRTDAADTEEERRAAHAVSDVPRATQSDVAQAGGVAEAVREVAADTVLQAPAEHGPSMSVGGRQYDLAEDGTVVVPNCFVEHLAQHGFTYVKKV